VRTELKLRKYNKKSIKLLNEKITSSGKRVVLFYCSSAGEYDQAVPVMKRYEEKGYLPVICFFSVSGIAFARKRKEKNPFFLYPIDTKKNAKRIMRATNPEQVIIVRQEIWPSFIYESTKTCPVYLINVSKSQSSDRLAATLVKKSLYPLFKKIFAVNESDKTYLISDLGLDPSTIEIAGDSKYDNVFERSLAQRETITNLMKEYAKITGEKGLEKTKVIVGSSWPEDVTLVSENIKELIDSYNFQLIIAPHKISEYYLKQTEDILIEDGLESVRFSERSDPDFSYTENQVIILDSMGQLTEMYALSEIALVGGANHYQVHNVLEPAAHGVNLTFGPLYKNSHEACDMVEESYVTPVATNKEFLGWLKQALDSPHRNESIRNYVEGLSGASEKIMTSINDSSQHD
jgi:3-deoxy-D-manno-octulosonic-acid transferase